MTPSASLREVKRAYKKLVKRWHPDRFARDPQAQAGQRPRRPSASPRPTRRSRTRWDRARPSILRCARTAAPCVTSPASASPREEVGAASAPWATRDRWTRSSSSRCGGGRSFGVLFLLADGARPCASGTSWRHRPAGARADPVVAGAPVARRADQGRGPPPGSARSPRRRRSLAGWPASQPGMGGLPGLVERTPSAARPRRRGRVKTSPIRMSVTVPAGAGTFFTNRPKLKPS